MPLDIDSITAESIPHNCLVRLQSVYDSLKNAEKKAADLLLKQPDFISHATITEAAQRAGCSEATLVRLSKKLGYAGYPELKAHLLQTESSDPVHLYENIEVNDDDSTIVSKVFQSSIQALTDTLNVLDKKQYGLAVEALCNAQKIMLCGTGDAAAVAQSGYQKFYRAGLNVHVSADPDVQLIAASQLARGDVFIAISHSGRTKTVVDAAKYAKISQATIICITNYPISPLAKNADIVLQTAAFAEYVKGEVMSKRLAELCVLESLYVNILLRQSDKLGYNLDKANLAVEINKL
ncbi:MurR/RpiR family transcriptional regulator [Mahella australiensis]|uniref:Transcriptional regulator, RpiR family n=1 Tax=Mahella australiensis (strain DSM 15567 / CIP 107919 / 50-1 BON) TaxID=697281 RepID=F4A0U7_MAHA5|nr:MurR/RpiR family transcriptional regulator [Mahella australiensis]AEE96993.1 transcriptional regulator, RpiR family [Mahella australiensis 50-1 BON]